MLNSLRAALICIFLGMWHVVVAATSGSEDTSAARAEAIDWVWAGQRVWFDFISQGDYQLVAYYDASRQMSVALRQLGDVNGAPWIYHKLPSYLGWDAHNSITAAFDANGHIHIVGNLHTNPLIYFRSTKPYDPRSLVPVKQMVSVAHEQRMTYPGFFVDRQRQLFFKYRDGSSNRGSWYYLSWDNSAKQWRNTYKKPVLDGQGQRSVYPYGPVFGPDGYAHLSFVWRETQIASSNHDLSYARSRDLVNWETSNGEPIGLPIQLANSEVIDPVPMHGGLLNGRTPIGFDSEQRVLVTYQKYDEQGNTQVYLRRKEGHEWREVRVSDWKKSRVDLDKGGALKLPIITSQPAFINSAKQIVVPAKYHDNDWQWILDANSLEVLSSHFSQSDLPNAITQYDIDNDIPQRVLPMRDEQTSPSTQYYISWEAMHPNRDQARENIPMPSTLRVHRLK